MHTYTKFALILVVVTMVVTGGCKRGDDRPFTRKSNQPSFISAATSPTTATRVVSGHVIRVPADFPTIVDAVQNAVSGDIVELSAGQHPLDQTIEISGITLRGAGVDSSKILWGGYSSGTAIVLGSNATIEGMQLPTVPWGISIIADTASRVRIADCAIRSCDIGISLTSCSDTSISNVIITYAQDGISLKDCFNTTIENNSIIRNNRALVINTSVSTLVGENILARVGHGAVLYDSFSEPTLTFRRNCIWSPQSSALYENMITSVRHVTPLGSDFVANPVIVNSFWGDFRLSPLSPCLNGGTNGRNVGSRFHAYAPAYMTDLTITLDPATPTGVLPNGSETEVLHIDLTADVKGDAFIYGHSWLTFAWNQAPVQNGVVGLKNLNTNQVFTTLNVSTGAMSAKLYGGTFTTIPAGQTVRWALMVDSAMFPTGVPITFTAGNIEWSDGRISWICDGRNPHINGLPVEF